MERDTRRWKSSTTTISLDRPITHNSAIIKLYFFTASRLSKGKATITYDNLTMQEFACRQVENCLGHVFRFTWSTSWNRHCWQCFAQIRLILVISTTTSHFGWKDSRCNCIDSNVCLDGRGELECYRFCQVISGSFASIVG